MIQRFMVVCLLLGLLYAPAGRADSTGGGTIPILTTATFADTIKNASRPVLIEFKAHWCPYCKKEQPDIENLKNTHASSLDVYQLDIDDEPDIAADYDAHVLPTLIIIYQGNVVGRSEGALYGHDLTDWVKDVQDDIRSKKAANTETPQAL
jgi:thioredoxin 1